MVVRRCAVLMVAVSFILFSSCTTMSVNNIKEDENVKYELIGSSFENKDDYLKVNFRTKKQYDEIVKEKKCTKKSATGYGFSMLGELFLEHPVTGLLCVPIVAPAVISFGVFADVVTLGHAGGTHCSTNLLSRTNKVAESKDDGAFSGNINIVSADDGTVIVEEQKENEDVCNLNFYLGKKNKSLLVHVEGELNVGNQTFNVDNQDIISRE